MADGKRSDFKDHNDFDQYAREHGSWFYDNGWTYKGEFFGAAYMRDEKSEAGRLVEYLLMLRDGDIPGRTLILHGVREDLVDVWAGQVETQVDFDRMNQIVAEYIGKQRP